MTLLAKNYTLAPIHLGHVLHCDASRVYTAKRPPPSFANWYGIAIHLFLERAMKYGREAALVYIKQKFPSKYAACARIAFDKIPQGDPEVQFLMDTQAREVVRGTPQDADPNTHVIGRADLLVDTDTCTYKPKRWPFPTEVKHWVIDYKSGKTATAQRPDSTQLESLAAMRWLELGCPDANVGTAIVAIPTAGDLSFTSITYSPKALHQLAEWIRRLHLCVLETRAERREEGVEPEFTPGRHCDKCSAYAECDARKAAEVIARSRGPSI